MQNQEVPMKCTNVHVQQQTILLVTTTLITFLLDYFICIVDVTGISADVIYIKQ